MLALHPPVLAAFGLSRGVGGFLLWGPLVAVVVLLVGGQVLRPMWARAAGQALSGVQEIISGVVEAQGTIAAAVEEQSASTAQAQAAITGASREAAAMAAELRRIVAPA